jgi:hypothetical protein
VSVILKGQTALITGAAHRLGRAIAERLADEGVHVVLHHHRSRDEAEEAAAAISMRGVRAWTVAADLESPVEAERLVDRAWQCSGGFSILINNASIFEKGALADTSYESFFRHLTTNAWAPLAIARAFARKAGSGQVVNLLDARVGGCNFTHAAYFLSKRTLDYLTRHLALELAPAFRINAVAPGLILPPAGEGPDYLDRLADTVPLRTHGEPADVAEAVVYLLRGSFVTGQTLFVDGGRHLRD